MVRAMAGIGAVEIREVVAGEGINVEEEGAYGEAAGSFLGFLTAGISLFFLGDALESYSKEKKVNRDGTRSAHVTADRVTTE